MDHRPVSMLHGVVGASSGGDRVPGPPQGWGHAVCAPGCKYIMHIYATHMQIIYQSIAIMCWRNTSTA